MNGADVKVFFFGKLGEAVGRMVEIEDTEAVTIADLRKFLADQYPHAARELENQSLRACVNDTIVGETCQINGADVEFFPPLSGG
jgi:molybdopterin converting factor small subunit